MMRRKVQTQCSECGCAMESGRRRGPWYCAECREATAKARRAAAFRKWAQKVGYRVGPAPARVCAWVECAQTFVPGPGQQNKRYCSADCGRKAKNEARAAVRRAVWAADRELRAEQARLKRAKLFALAGRLQPKAAGPGRELDALDRKALEVWQRHGYDQAGAA